MADIFLSYARENSEVAKRLSESLENIGWSVWWDWQVPPGQTWSGMIEQSLTSMRCMVVLWSTDSIDSEWVKEIAGKGRAQCKLIAALIDDVKPPIGFPAIQPANLIGWDGTQDFPGFGNLIDALEAQLGKPVKNPDAAPATASEINAPPGEQSSSLALLDSTKLRQLANRLSWHFCAKATVLVIILVAASSQRQVRDAGTTAPAALPVTFLDAGEMRPSPPLTIRGPSTAKRREARRSQTTAPSAYGCSEILARAQLGEPLTNADREALRKDCPS